jgi:hypothetical protein
MRASSRIATRAAQRRWRFWHTALLLVAGDVEAERAPMILPGPCQESTARIISPRRPLAKSDGGLLRLSGEAQEGVAQGELGYAEVLFEELEEPMVYAVVSGGAVRWVR